MNSLNEFSTDKDVLLVGILIYKHYYDANDNIERVVVLRLNSSINVKRDEFGGPVKDIKDIQLIFRETIQWRSFVNTNREVQVEGRLFYPMTAHQHTRILLETKAIRWW